VIREFLGFFITGFLLVLELALVFGMLLVVLSLPYAIAIYQFEAMPGSTETAWALTIGLMLMGVWAMFLLKGGRLKIRQGFEAMKQLSLKALGSAKR
jgi:hypothetical protein